MPIDSILENGQIVEVITSSSSKGPSRDWLKIVRSGEARNKIRQYFKKEMRAENIVVGKTEIDRELKRYGKSYSEAQKTEIVTNVASRIGLPDSDDLYNNIGYGGLSVSKIAAKLKDEFTRVVCPPEPVEEVTLPEKTVVSTGRITNSQSVIIDSVSGCEVKFAKCCNPLPGDSIIGFITKGYGVSIHKYDCPNAQAGLQKPEDKDRWVVASWSTQVEKREVGKFDAVLNVYAQYSSALFADVSMQLKNMSVDVISMSAKENLGNCLLTVVIKCSNIDHLHSIMSQLRKVPNVRDVTRGNERGI